MIRTMSLMVIADTRISLPARSASAESSVWKPVRTDKQAIASPAGDQASSTRFWAACASPGSKQAPRPKAISVQPMSSFFRTIMCLSITRHEGHRCPYAHAQRGLAQAPERAWRALHGKEGQGRADRHPPRRRALHDAHARDVRLRGAHPGDG